MESKNILEILKQINETGLDVDNTGLEFATYMIDFEKYKIFEKINNCNLSENQIQNLMLNIYNVMHQNVLKIRDFDKLNISDYRSTSHNYNLSTNSDRVYSYFFEKNANELLNGMEILYSIKGNYQYIDISKYDSTKYYLSYFYELLPKTKNMNLSILVTICKNYDDSNIPELLELSNFMKKILYKKIILIYNKIGL